MNNLEMEHWKKIGGFPNYEVSNLGRVRSLPRTVMRRDGQPQGIRGGILKPVIRDNRGVRYGEVTLSDADFGVYHVIRKVHHLVLEAFVGPRPDGAITRHLNGDSLDNQLKNLVYGTHQENVRDRTDHGNTWHPRGETNPRAKLNAEAVKVIRFFYREGRAIYGMCNKLARAYDVSVSLVSQIGRGIVWDEAA